jgi:hypothetical protein
MTLAELDDGRGRSAGGALARASSATLMNVFREIR